MDQALRLHEQLQNIDRYTIANKLYDCIFRQSEMIREESCKFTSELMSHIYKNVSDPYYLYNRIKGLYDVASMIVQANVRALERRKPILWIDPNVPVSELIKDINDSCNPNKNIDHDPTWKLHCQKVMLQAANTLLDHDEKRRLVAKVVADTACDFGYGYVASLGKAATLSRIIEARNATGVLSNADKIWRGIGTVLDKPKEIIAALKNAVHSSDPVYVTPEGITFTAAEVESLLEASNELKAAQKVAQAEVAIAETTEVAQTAKTVATTESIEATQVAKGNAHAMQTRSKARLAAQQTPQQTPSNKVAPATTVAEVETETAQVVNTITTETTEATKTAEFLENLEVASVSPEFAQATKTMQQIEHICAPIKNNVIANLRQKFDLKHTMGFGPKPNRFLKWSYDHVFTPEITIKGKNIMLSGFHHDPGCLIENSGLIRLTNKRMGPSGTYIADVWIGNRCFKDKTFFPADWSQEKIMEKTLEAYKESLISDPIPQLRRDGKYMISGKTSEGIMVKISISQNGEVATYYPCGEKNIFN